MKALNEDLQPFSCVIKPKSPEKPQNNQDAATSTKFSNFISQSRKSESVLPIFNIGIKLFENKEEP